MYGTKKLLFCGTGEVSDSEKDASDGDFEEFDDGLDENMIGDEQDKKRLEQMTEKEREQEIFNRLEKREAMRTRYIQRVRRKRDQNVSGNISYKTPALLMKFGTWFPE